MNSIKGYFNNQIYSFEKIVFIEKYVSNNYFLKFKGTIFSFEKMTKHRENKKFIYIPLGKEYKCFKPSKC